LSYGDGRDKKYGHYCHQQPDHHFRPHTPSSFALGLIPGFSPPME
jgi:hypothetical protein